MIEHQLLPGKGVLVVRPHGALSAADFAALTAEADVYIGTHGTLKGLMIVAPKFPGWENIDGAVAHFRFIRDHQRKIGRVAIVSDSDILSLLPGIANHFVNAEVRHFKGADETQALDWLAG